MTLHIRGTLVTVGALAIGTGRPDVRSDQPVLADQRDRPVIPGSSLAGALRAAALRVMDPDTVEHLLGPETIDDPGDAERSAVSVHDAVLDMPMATVLPRQLRQHVGIDRERLAARDAIRFDRETWPLGLRFHLALDLDEHGLGDDGLGDTDGDLLHALLLALAELTGPLGGIGAGRCAVAVEDLTVHRAAGAAALRAAAERRWEHPDEPEPLGAAVPGVDWPMAEVSGDLSSPTVAVDLTLRLRTLTPLLVREPRSPFEQAEDNVPFSIRCVEQVGGAATVVRRPAIPGDSLLGVIRQRAERALALAGVAGGDPFEDAASRARGLDHPILRTFGLVGSAEESAAGAVRIEDAVLVDRADGDAVWAADVAASDQRWAVVLPRVHIDRLTSAPLGSEKFEDTALADGRDLQVRITVCPSGRPFEDMDLALVAVGLRDVVAGAAGVGGSVRSGYGTLGLVAGELVEHVRSGSGEDGRTRALPAVDLRGDGDDPAEFATALTWGERWGMRLDAAWREATGGAR
jgi:CRISPR/Cas system CSM-associated protein Csm3 (group 7 of RAMP superfamily)